MTAAWNGPGNHTELLSSSCHCAPFFSALAFAFLLYLCLSLAESGVIPQLGDLFLCNLVWHASSLRQRFFVSIRDAHGTDHHRCHFISEIPLGCVEAKGIDCTFSDECVCGYKFTSSNINWVWKREPLSNFTEEEDNPTLTPVCE